MLFDKQNELQRGTESAKVSFTGPLSSVLSLELSSNFFNLKVSRSFENSCAPKVNRQFSSELQRDFCKM